MKWRYFVAMAVAVFLIFVGMSGYQFVCPLGWSVTCVRKDSSGAELFTLRIHALTEGLAKQSPDDAVNEGGTTCAPV
jgi:hypothetical protein